jgi:hypothetical protein
MSEAVNVKPKANINIKKNEFRNQFWKDIIIEQKQQLKKKQQKKE